MNARSLLNVRDILTTIGEDPDRDGLKDTPSRVVRSWDQLFCGYDQDSREVLSRVFECDSDQMVVLKDIEFYSTCEHHMLPFFGRISIGYVPKGKKVVGISKLARLVEIFSRRLQVQERLTEEIASAMKEHLQPRGVIVVARAQHLCMVARGVEKQNSEMITSAIRGVFRDREPREEFFRLIGGQP